MITIYYRELQKQVGYLEDFFVKNDDFYQLRIYHYMSVLDDARVFDFFFKLYLTVA